MGLIGCPEMLVMNFHSMLHNIVEKHISHDILATQALVWCVLVCCFEREFLDLTYLSAKFQGK